MSAYLRGCTVKSWLNFIVAGAFAVVALPASSEATDGWVINVANAEMVRATRLSKLGSASLKMVCGKDSGWECFWGVSFVLGRCSKDYSKDGEIISVSFSGNTVMTRAICLPLKDGAVFLFSDVGLVDAIFRTSDAVTIFVGKEGGRMSDTFEMKGVGDASALLRKISGEKLRDDK